MSEKTSAPNQQSETNSSTQLNQEQSPADQNQQDSQGIGLLQTIFSILAALFGVQSESKRKRDFEQGKASNFIIAGIIFVIAFIITLYLIVSTVLANVGSN